MSVILSHQQITALFTALPEMLLNIWSKTGPDTAPPNTTVNLFHQESGFFILSIHFSSSNWFLICNFQRLSTSPPHENLCLLSINNAVYLLNNTWQQKEGFHCSTSLPPSLDSAKSKAGAYLWGCQTVKTSIHSLEGGARTAQDTELGKNSNPKCNWKWTEEREANTWNISVKFWLTNNKWE